MAFKVNEKKLQLGFNTVNVGKRKSEDEAQLVVLSTEGSFKITAPVAVALGVKVGEYVQFVDNFDLVTNAINEKAEMVVDFCNEQGLDINSDEAKELIHKEFDMVGIIKGVQQYDSKGNPLTSRERMTIEDKKAYVKNNFDELMDSILSEADEELKANLTRDGITVDEQIEIMAAFVQPTEVAKISGSKTFSATKALGFNTCTFSCSRMWNILKSDLEHKTSINRIFTLDLKNSQMIEISNGFETIKVKALLLEDSIDKQVTVRNSTSK